jgi:hypothetical protein
MAEPKKHLHKVPTALPHIDLRAGVGQEDKLVEVCILGHVDQSAEGEVIAEVKSERVIRGPGRSVVAEEFDSELAGVVVDSGHLVLIIEGSILGKRSSCRW